MKRRSWKRWATILLLGILFPLFSACSIDSGRLSREERENLTNLFLETIQNESITTYLYREFGTEAGYGVWIQFFDGDYSLADKSPTESIYYRNGFLYMIDLSDNGITKQECPFEELEYLARVEATYQTLMAFFPAGDARKYTSEIKGIWYPGYNSLLIDLDEEALVRDGILEAGHQISLTVDFSLENTPITVRFEIYDEASYWEKIFSLETQKTENYIDFPGNLD